MLGDFLWYKRNKILLLLENNPIPSDPLHHTRLSLIIFLEQHTLSWFIPYLLCTPSFIFPATTVVQAQAHNLHQPQMRNMNHHMIILTETKPESEV